MRNGIRNMWARGYFEKLAFGLIMSGATIVNSLFSLQALAAPVVIYDVNEKRTLRDFQLFLEGPLIVGDRATLMQTSEGLTSRPTDTGGFTLYKFADLDKSNFNLRAVFTIPSGIRYSNSGIYLLYTDPTRPIADELPANERAAFLDALENARQRAARFGAGPYEADFFARELQIIAGFEPGLPPENHGAGAFYGVDLTTDAEILAGNQRTSPYNLVIGDTYELTIEARQTGIKSYLRSVNFQASRVLVAEFVNVTREQDIIRGGVPIALLLQAFPMNGRDTKGPIFKHLSVEQFDLDEF